jgi:hypothetical protein
MLTFPYQLIAEFTCLITSVLLLARSDRYWQTLRFYLCFVLIIESIAYYMVYVAKYYTNHWLYNLSMLVEYNYGIWLLSNLINYRNIKSVTVVAYFLFYVSYIVELVKQGGILHFFSYTDTVGSVLMIGLCMAYYYLLFQEEEYVDILKEPLFWLVSGYFIFYTTSISVDTFFQKLVQMQVVHSISLRNIILKILNFIFYGCWIKSFLCIRIKRKSILPL